MTVTFPTRPGVSAPPVTRNAPCQSDPDLWAEAGDDQTLRDLCRFSCRRRVDCARDALATPDAAGIWAGIYIPPADEDSSRHDRTRTQDYARHRLRVIATELRYRSPAAPSAAEPDAEPDDKPNGQFAEVYTELRHNCGLADWQIAKRLGITNLSLYRQLTRYNIAPQPEFVTMCTQEKKDMQPGGESR